MGPITCTQKCGRHKELLAADDEGDVVLEEDEVQDALARARMHAASAGGRRRGIAAASVAKDDIRTYKKPHYSKDVATEQKIIEVIKANDHLQVLFGHLDQSSLRDVINAVYTREAKEGEDLIRQGDEGDCLYIISEGNVDVFVRRQGVDYPSGQEKGAKVATLGSASLFGELALMYSTPRSATVSVCSSHCTLWRLDREPFKMLLAQQSQSKFELHTGWLEEVDMLKTLNVYELSRLCECLQNKICYPEEVIMTQGEEGDEFFILEEGSCNAYINGDHGEKLVKTYSGRGEFFGELALLGNTQRKATVRAGSDGATLLVLSKDDFEVALGPVQAFLEKNAAAYPSYEAFADS